MPTLLSKAKYVSYYVEIFTRKTCSLPRYVSQYKSLVGTFFTRRVPLVIVILILMTTNKKHIDYDCQMGQNELTYDKALKDELTAKYLDSIRFLISILMECYKIRLIS